MCSEKMPSRLVGKTKERKNREKEPSRLLGKKLDAPTTFEDTTGLKVGTVLINTERAADPKRSHLAEFTITGMHREKIETLIQIEDPSGMKGSKSEKTLLEEIARGKYRYK